MTWDEIYTTIKSNNGIIDGAINWTWASFESEADATCAFNLIKDHVDHRGLYPAHNAEDTWAFRFR